MRNRLLSTCLAAALAFGAGAADAEERLRTFALQTAQPLDNPIVGKRIDVIKQQLERLGWREGKTIRYVVQSSLSDPARRAKLAAELVRSKPDVIVADSTVETLALLNETREIPIIFGNSSDPIGGGLLRSVERPERNVTGFSEFNPAMSVKWVELLLEAAPGATEIAVLFNPVTTPAAGQSFLDAMRAGTGDLGLSIAPATVESAAQIEAAIAALRDRPRAGLVVLPDSFTYFHAKTITRAAAAHKVPAIYAYDAFVREGGLMSYNVSREEPIIGIADYADLILRGAKISDLPVQFPRRFELVLNLRAAAELGLTPPPSLRVRATRTLE
jgi:putative ABC transport system substrate-binding protein